VTNMSLPDVYALQSLPSLAVPSSRTTPTLTRHPKVSGGVCTVLTLRQLFAAHCRGHEISVAAP